MTLGPHVPEWARLHAALSELVSACEASFAAIIDEGNGLWCVAYSKHIPRGGDEAADLFYRTEVSPRAKAMLRGARLSIDKRDGDDRYIAESFASIYVVVVWFHEPSAPDLLQARVRRALPRLEALTLALPSPDDPGGDVGARKLRA